VGNRGVVIIIIIIIIIIVIVVDPPPPNDTCGNPRIGSHILMCPVGCRLWHDDLIMSSTSASVLNLIRRRCSTLMSVDG
jgi:hypothetical protein